MLDFQSSFESSILSSGSKKDNMNFLHPCNFYLFVNNKPMTNITDFDFSIRLDNAMCLAKLVEHELLDPINDDEIVHDVPHAARAYVQTIKTVEVDGEDRIHVHLEITPESDPYFMKYYK